MHGTALHEGVTLVLCGSYAWNALHEGVTLVLCGYLCMGRLYVKV